MPSLRSVRTALLLGRTVNRYLGLPPSVRPSGRPSLSRVDHSGRVAVAIDGVVTPQARRSLAAPPQKILPR